MGWPFSYNMNRTLYIAHGAEPLIHPPDYEIKNFINIGFKPDKLTYPEIPKDLKDFIDKAVSPVIFISLGTVLLISSHDLRTLFEALKNQQDYTFVWAVKTAMLEDLGVAEQPFISDRLYMGKYLPQGNLLGHPKVKLFVTHCGSNSVQDSIYAMKPMITHPGFGDQVYLSNIIGKLGIGRFLVNFNFEKMKQLIDEMLQEENYNKMIDKLAEFRQTQINLGGFETGARIIEDVISGKIPIDRNLTPDEVFGIPLFGIRATVIGVVSVILVLFLLVLLVFLKLSSLVLRFVKCKVKKKKE